jgi:3-deoxy-D-manno-octulosonate 8-phosphate phosphatase (KDO 8-P phosphatase)
VKSEQLQNIKLLLLDVDGVMTDGRIVYDANGVETKFFNVKDGHGIKMLQRAGVEVGIISGRASQVVTNRAAELGITIVYQKALDKLAPYQEILLDKGLKDDEVAFMGDDIIDIPVMRRVGFAAAPLDAIDYVSEHADYVARNRGGWGAVREVCDLIIKGKGLWDEVTARSYQE